MIVYQAQSRPASRLRVGTHVELYSSTGGYTGVSRCVGAMRVPEPLSLDLVLRPTQNGEPTIILNVSTQHKWVVVPLWAKIMKLFLRRAATITYPIPTLAPGPPASTLAEDAPNRSTSTLDAIGSDDEERSQ